MKILSIAFYGFRSLEQVKMLNCGAVNTFIGKNNAGKSNILTGLDVALQHLKLGAVTSDWPVKGRQVDEFNARLASQNIRIGLTFEVHPSVGDSAISAISNEIEGMEDAINGIDDRNRISVIICGKMVNGKVARYVQEIAFGSLSEDAELALSGRRIFFLPDPAAELVIEQDREKERIYNDLKVLKETQSELKGRFNDDRDYRRYLLGRIIDRTSVDLAKKLQKASNDAGSAEEFDDRFAQIRAELLARLQELNSMILAESMQGFAGSVRRVPEYLVEIIKLLGTIKVQHLAESKEPIGPDEAMQLLKLKTTRGGPGQLTSIQAIVKNLLGVSVDAFAPEDSRRARSAEMDIDDFLVEMNGSGIREALRIILDIELKKPDLVLIEEPEVHLHPGLEKAMHEYLIGKGKTQQIFVATHSTNFLDVASRQNVFIVSRVGTRTCVQEAVSESDILKIPGDIGLRPSTLFMYDRLVFVEGQSDEDVLRVLARATEVDLSSKNIGFVKMGGVSNTFFFATDATIDLLAKRQIPISFLIDSDERSSDDIGSLKSRIGIRASLHVLEKREIENFLLDPDAIFELINEKFETSGSRGSRPENVNLLDEKIREVALSLKERTIQLTAQRRLLRPVFVERISAISHQEKLTYAAEELAKRIEEYPQEYAKISDEVAGQWEQSFLSRAPGSEILDGVFQHYGFNFSKERDSVRLAQKMRREKIDRGLVSIIKDF